MTKIDADTACLTWIRTGDLDQVVRVFGGHPLVSEPETLDGLFSIAPEDLPDATPPAWPWWPATGTGPF